jgi:hypothetical protein
LQSVSVIRRPGTVIYWGIRSLEIPKTSIPRIAAITSRISITPNGPVSLIISLKALSVLNFIFC